MKNKFVQANLLLIAIFCLSSFNSASQVPGFINRQAASVSGKAVLDPNGDGYTSISNTGFGTNDVANSEIPYRGIRAYSVEPNGDLVRGPNHGYSDFVPDSAGNGFYNYFTVAQQVLFRFRVGAIMPGSKGYSVLMDTDGKFGATGPNADPNYLPSTTGTNGNPGFEIEIVLETNFRIAIYNVDGTSSPVLIKQYTNWQDMSQVSIAATNDNGDPDFLIDFYIPFSDLQAAPFNLTSSSTIRLTATTVMAPGAAIGGPRSDIYGISTNHYEDFIDNQPPCSIFNNPITCSTAMCTAAPSVNSPISTGTINISGTWIKSTATGAASTATITVYKNSVAIGTVPAVTSGAGWTLNNITLINGDIITAKALATGESMCLTSNTVVASTCNSSNRPATPVLSCTSGSKGLSGTNLSTGWTVHVDNLTRNTLNDNVINTGGLFGATTGTSPAINWPYSGGCSSGAPLTSGSYKIYYTDNTTGCSSLPAYFCAAGNGGNALAGALAVPTITAPSNSVFTTAINSISGTTDANATLYLYINSTNVQTTTASAGGIFTFSGLTLLYGQQLYIVVELNTGVVGTSKCANQTALYTVGCYTQTPLINGDNNNQITAGLPITGTSAEPAGTTIRIYTAANTLVATTTVQANGSWSTGNAGTLPAIYNAVAATSYYANAQNGACGVSGNSATYATLTATSSSRCGSITGPVTAGVTSISGTVTGSFSTSTIRLYLDGQLIGSNITSTTIWGPITVNSTAANTLYPNGVLTIGIQESGKQEVLCPASAITIICSPTPVAPDFTPANTTINQYQSVTYTISNAVSGSFYAIADSASGQSLGQGKWAIANGVLSLTTSAFNIAGTFKVIIKSTSLSGVTQCSAGSLTGVVIVDPVILPLTLIEFKGTKQTDKISLKWITENEDQLNHFEIERSSNGYTFEKIGQLPAIGYSNSRNAYLFSDTHPFNLQNHYRLKMMDNDGKYTFSNIIVFSGSGLSIDMAFSAAPNPFSEVIHLNIILEKNQPLKIQLLDFAGRIVFTKDAQGLQGNNLIPCNGLEKLSRGIYFIRIITSGVSLQQKVLKVN